MTDTKSIIYQVSKHQNEYNSKSGICFAALLAVFGASVGENAFAQTTPPTEVVTTTQNEIDPADPFAVPETNAPPANETTAAVIAPELVIAPPPPPPKDSASIIQGGKLILELRPRFESVDQTGIANQASAATLRTRLGWETGAWHGAKGLLEFESVAQMGSENYNTTLNGKTTYPIVADPDINEINRAQITWSNGPNLTIVVGRQRINLDDQRFVGGVAWRQDEQTFDGAKIDFGFMKLRGNYTFISRVNRIFAEAQDWEGDSHLVNLNYAVSEPLKLQAFVYDLNFGGTRAANLTAARNASTTTIGGRVSGKTWAGLIGVSYGLTYAKQEENGANPANLNLGFYSAELIGAFDIYTVRLNYEVAEGNGVRNFSTPLGTVHAFQGWSDAFDLNNPTQLPNGVEDLNLSINLRPRWKRDHFFNLDFTIKYHDFQTELTGIDIGTELDVQFTAAFTPQLSFIAKAAEFDGSGLAGSGSFADRTKFWIGFEYKL